MNSGIGSWQDISENKTSFVTFDYYSCCKTKGRTAVHALKFQTDERFAGGFGFSILFNKCDPPLFMYWNWIKY